MRRRSFLTLLGVSAAVWPLAARAQQSGRVRRVGIMVPFSETNVVAQARIAAFRQEMGKLGWSEGRNVVFQYVFVGPRERELMRAAADQLVATAPDAILAETTLVLSALQQATPTLPIVFVNVADPIEAGFIAGLPRPGGNITGFTNIDHATTGKWLELLKEITPSLTKALVILDPKNPSARLRLRAIEAGAQVTGVQLVTAAILDTRDIDRVIDAFAQETRGSLIVLPSPLLDENQALIFAAAIRHRMPAVYAFRTDVVNGGLMCYSTEIADLFRRAASYVGRVLDGENPADLPVQQPVKFELVINLKTAKAIGLDIPPTLLVRADEVIE
jgi:ABC-type uncharacterized transport system substrate-binding protein